ncbi:hypothetical protein ACFU6I_44775 [Streptomyces sp. NPDC057486]|uniref:hypothetical protein n=1 Tax=Streptomyces sp. NPDC057486 TaxID=3346145 RepID=UPI0036D01477
MSNSYAQAVFRTPDLGKALEVAHQLLALAETSGMVVTFLARVHASQTLEELSEILTELSWWSESADRPASSDDSDDPAGHLPVRVKSFCQEPDTVDAFLAAVGNGASVVCWDFSSWPEAPEVGLGIGGERGAYVSLCVNARDLYLDEPSDDHTVYVHVKQVEAERAPWLAAQVGLHVFGELVMADD